MMAVLCVLDFKKTFDKVSIEVVYKKMRESMLIVSLRVKLQIPAKEEVYTHIVQIVDFNMYGLRPNVRFQGTPQDENASTGQQLHGRRN